VIEALRGDHPAMERIFDVAHVELLLALDQHDPELASESADGGNQDR
jgi:hypothetical protein